MASFDSILSTPMLLKHFNFTHILQYCDVLNDAHSCCNDYRHIIIKGQSLFKEHFITDIMFKVDDIGRYTIQARVKAEMKKRSAYTVTVLIEPSGSVLEGECQCPGGIKPACCKHLFGLLSAVEDYSRKELYASPTENLQKWHQPTTKPVSPKLTNSIFGKRSAHKKIIDTSVDYSTLSQLNQSCPIFSALNIGPKICTDIIFYDYTLPLPAFITSGFGNDIPERLKLNEILFYHENVRKNIVELVELEKNTMSQDNDCWRIERQKRLTASNVHIVLHSKKDIDDLALTLFKPSNNLSSILPICLGKDREEMVKNIIRNKFPNHIFRNTGLVVHPLYPFLGASPDGFLYNDMDSMLVEIKCLFNPSKKTLECLSRERKDFCLMFNTAEVTWKLKHNHSYYTQIQFQMFCSNINKCLLALFYYFRKPLHLEVIHAEAQFCEKNLSNLSKFYFQHYLPMLSSKNIN